MYGNAKNDKQTMKDLNDTICAISTPAGTGGIAVIRVSGPEAIATADRIWSGKPLADVKSHTAHLGTVADTDGSQLDQAVATVFRGPHSFTGEDVVELSVHGSPYIQRRLLDSLCSAGARMAEAGEFTRRAFTSGRLDLAQAEAVADMIAADSKAAHRLAISQMRGDFSRRLADLHDDLLQLVSLLELELDFSEEDVEFASRQKLRNLASNIRDTVSRLARSFSTGDAIRHGVSVAIVGQTNAGKSTLLNQLLHDDRAIVSDVHGTTRDIIEDTIDIGGITFRFIDTAGLRETDDTVENLGIQRTIARLSIARIVLWVIDATDPATGDPAVQRILDNISPDQDLIVVINKTDAADPAPAATAVSALLSTAQAVSTSATQPDAISGESPSAAGTPCRFIPLSAASGDGIDVLEAALVNIAGAADIAASDVIVTNARHHQALLNAETSLTRAIDGIDNSLSGDFIAQDLRETLHHLSTITGTITTTDILQNIFSHFCVGK